jgi:3'-5' exonuclease
MQHFKEILFIDIETVPTQPDFYLLPEQLQAEWIRKAKFIKTGTGEPQEPASAFNDRGGIFSEFAKVVCIGFGSLHETDNGLKMRLKSLVNEDEKKLLSDFCEVVTKFNQMYKNMQFCGHNIKEFDVPFICRRMIINGLGLPECMQISGKKPWEVPHIDTMELWRFGDFKNFTSLSLLAEVLGIPTPKSDLDGSMVAGVFWKDKDLARIGSYCLQDVLSTARVFLRLKGIHNVNIEPIFVE